MGRIDSDVEPPDTVRPAIPTMLTSFVGRERELTDVVRLLASSRLVALTGAAGCGKTRLALRVTSEVHRQYEDGIRWVDLAPLMDPALVPQAVAKAMLVAEQTGRSTVDGLLDELRDKQLLLVLDNCERVLDACRDLASALLKATEISILATSREPLTTTGEMRYPLPPMALPPLTVPAGEIGGFDAIRLFVERARAIVPNFALTLGNEAIVAGICRRLDGIPLALELASARLNVLTVEEIAGRLDRCFDLLPPAPHVTQSHHRTLRAAIDWSYDLLSGPEQVMLRRLSVFAGGCSLATVEAVCAGDGIERDQLLGLLSSLVDKSLVGAQTLQRGEARYSLLEVVRLYTQEKLVATDEWTTLRDRHLQCFLQLTEETAPKLSGPYQRLWLDWLDNEYDNIRAALAWSVEGGRIEAGLRLAIAIYQFWTIRDYVEEGLTWLARLLARADEGISLIVRANAVANATFMAGFRGATSAQVEYGRQAAVLAEAAGDADKPALFWALTGQAHGARAAGDFQTEFAIVKRVIGLLREFGDPYRLGLSLTIYSYSAMTVGDYGAAHVMLDEGLVLLRAAGNPYRIAMALNFSGDLARCEQEYARAQGAYEESVSLLRELDAPRDLASALHNLGHACLHLGDVERARSLFGECMAIQQAHRNKPGMGECLIGFAALAVVKDLPVAGARLLAAAVAIGGQRVATAWAATRMEYEQRLALVRARLSETELRAEEAAGRAFSLEQAVEYALGLPLDAAKAQRARAKSEELTAREREIAALIALGRSNGEIADQLVVSKRTVEKHIANILSKLEVANRAQIVRWAIESGHLK